MCNVRRKATDSTIHGKSRYMRFFGHFGEVATNDDIIKNYCNHQTAN